MASDDAPAYEVRPARVGDEDGICAVCRAGFAESSAGLLSPATVERRSEEYYNPARVRHEILTGGVDHRWQGYVVAVSRPGDVLGAAGGGITDGTVGHLYVLYLDPALRGRGIGTALLDVVTDRQRETGVVEQWVSVTEGNDLGIPFYLARGFVVRDRVVYGTTGEGTPEAWSLRMSRPV